MLAVYTVRSWGVLILGPEELAVAGSIRIVYAASMLPVLRVPVSAHPSSSRVRGPGFTGAGSGNAAILLPVCSMILPGLWCYCGNDLCYGSVDPFIHVPLSFLSKSSSK